MRRRMIGLIGIALLVSMAFAPAGADVPQAGAFIFAGPGAKTAGFATPVAAAVQGEPLTLVSVDIDPHNVVSCHYVGSTKVCDYGPSTQPWCFLFTDGLNGKCPLFWSPLVYLGGLSTPIYGLENAETGRTYGFWCEPHKDSMTGTLLIVPKPA